MLLCPKCTHKMVKFFTSYHCLKCDHEDITRIMEAYNAPYEKGYFPYGEQGIHKALDVNLPVPEKLQKHPFKPGIVNDMFAAEGRGGCNLLRIRTISKGNERLPFDDDMIEVSLGVGCIHEYNKVMPLSVLVYFLSEHLQRYDYDITKFFTTPQHECAGYIDYSAEDKQCEYTSKVRDVQTFDSYVAYNDPRVPEDKEYTITEPRYIVTYAKKYNSENEYTYYVHACIDEENVSPFLLGHIHELFCDTYDDQLGDKEGLYIVRVKAVDEKSWCHEYATYEYDSYLGVLESMFICPLEENV